MSEGPGERLPDQPDDKGKQDAELDNEMEEMTSSDTDPVTIHDEANVQEVRQALQDLDAVTFHDGSLEQAQTTPVVNAGEMVEVTGNSPGLVQAQAAVQTAVAGIAAQPTERQAWNTQRFIALFGGIAGIGGLIGVIYTIVKGQTTDSPTPDVPIPEDVEKKIRELVRDWWGQTDTQYWTQFAKTVDAQVPPFTIEDQILFMNYTIDLSPAVPWIWRSDKDIQAVVVQLYNAFVAAGSKTSAMYSLVPTIRYLDTSTKTPVPLPRPEAATVLRYALAWILIHPNVPMPPEAAEAEAVAAPA